MMRLRIRITIISLFVIFITTASTYIVQAQGVFTFEDVMQFKEIQTPALSSDGKWISYGVWPERGDGEARVESIDGRSKYVIDRGTRPQISADSRWAVSFVQPPFIEAQNAGRNRPRQSLALLNLQNGEQEIIENVRAFELSNDGRWLRLNHYQTKEITDLRHKNSQLGSPVTLISLGTDDRMYHPFVNESAFDSTSRYFVYSIVDTSGTENSLNAVQLSAGTASVKHVISAENGYYNNLTWDHKRSRLAFTVSVLDDQKEYHPFDAFIISWQAFNGEPQTLVRADDAEEGYRLRHRNNLTWTYDGKRLFYSVMDAEMVALDEKSAPDDSLTADNLYDLELILNGVEGKVWHWDDPLIKTHEKQTWNSRKNQLYTSVYHLDEGRNVQLANKELPNIRVSHNTGSVLGSSNLPYLKLITWDGNYNDFYLVDLNTGETTQILEQQRFGAQLSPSGNFTTWFDGTDWILMNSRSGNMRNLTADLNVPFADEENDRPQPSGSYGIAGWTEGERSVLIYDKYDIWQFDTSNGSTINLTDGKGREEMRIFRIRDLEPNRDTFGRIETLLLTMYHDWNKNYGFYEARIGRSGVSRLMEGDERYNFVAKAENSSEILFTKQRYDVYPNLWISNDSRFRNTRQLTSLYEDLTERWAWGNAELVEWINMDGRTVQGVLIYPGDYEPGKRYPVFIYYYERFSQRLYDFNHPVTNHRPNIAQYTSDGYAVFLPDVWFDIPLPGYSATKNLVPGVHKLIEMGVADPDAIGLHGHSWSGYLTAHVITQTDIFAAAIGGAPVGNMTSAYGGIRWGSGLARQFQYEQTQSRLGVSMWENLAPYIENSPVFFADRINTPLMIQHGDADDAVPWYQSIELYLALRRMGKDSVFLHYYNEPHHLQKFANKLDYAIKMKEYMDHYLKGVPAAKWITDGVPYLGE